MRLPKLLHRSATVNAVKRQLPRTPFAYSVALVTLAAGVALIAAPASAQDPPAAPQAPAAASGNPKLVLVQDTWDFGEKWRGEPASGSISFSNGGDAELIISKVKPSCGCTGVKATKMTLQPGESAELLINYDTDRPGDQVKKVIRIFTNEADNAEHRVNVVGKVRSLIEMKPQERVLFGAMSRDKAASQEIVLRNLYDKPLDLKVAEANIEGLKVEFEETEPGKAWKLRATTETPLASDILRGDIVLQTGFDGAPTVKIPVYGRVQKRVAVTPPRIMIPAQGDSAVTRTLRVSVRDNSEVHVTEVESSNPQIETEVMPDSKTTVAGPGAMSTAAVIRVTIPPTAELAAMGETITIHTDDPETPILTATVIRMPPRPAGG